MGESDLPKISIVMLANNLEINGISTVIMNYCGKLDLKQFDVSIIAGMPIAEMYRKECRKMGIRIFELPNRKTASAVYYSALNSLLKKKKFDIFHVHCNSATVTVELFLAWLNGIKVRIAHSHTTSCNHRMLNKLLMPAFQMLYTHGFSCGQSAGQWLFRNKPFNIIPNGFQTEAFIFNPRLRNKIRSETNTEGKLILGHIGRFNEHKNQLFLLDIFGRVAAKREDAVLLLVGTGPDFEHIKSLINTHPYKDRILVYGETTEPAAMYSAMDIFLFPSKHEGLGIVALEAQISGLPCLASETVPKDVILGEHIDFIPLDNPDLWVERLTAIKVETEKRKLFYDTNREKIAKYDITENIKLLEKIYMDLYHQIKDA